MCLQSIMKKKKTWSPFRFLWIPRKGKTLGGCQGAIPIENEKKTIQWPLNAPPFNSDEKKDSVATKPLIFKEEEKNRLVLQGTILNMEEK